MLERIALAPGEAVLEVGCAATRQGVPGPITFEVGEVQALPFPDGTFDVCCAERLLEHLPDAGHALREMARVPCSGGRIAVFDFD